MRLVHEIVAFCQKENRYTEVIAVPNDQIAGLCTALYITPGAPGPVIIGKPVRKAVETVLGRELDPAFTWFYGVSRLQ